MCVLVCVSVQHMQRARCRCCLLKGTAIASNLSYAAAAAQPLSLRCSAAAGAAVGEVNLTYTFPHRNFHMT